MAKEAAATKWKVIAQDDTGAFVTINYVCPYCGKATGELIFVDANDVSLLDGSWGTDQVCGLCNKEVALCCD